MAQQVYCNNCGSTTNPKVAGSIIITLILIWFAVIPAIIYEIWRAKNKRCRQCGSPAIMPLHSPLAQQTIQRQQDRQNYENLMREMNELKSQPIPAPVIEPNLPPSLPPELPPVEVFAIDKNINGGLIEFFGLQRWYQATFNDEQKHRLEERFGTVSGNKLASGPVRFKFPNVDILQFLYDLEEKLKPQEFSDVYKLVDEQFKIEAGKFCKIVGNRWDNEKYYKSWFALMKYRIDALNKLKDDNYFRQGQFDAIDDNFATQPCLDISGKGFNILNGDLDRAFDQHFFEPTKGCRCTVRGYRD
ncbi:hypothetical protein [Psychrobacter maritimus]|uniref:hypothetical protein n=1 Tax=Psychrobacter maritimus TaxID=256325 RepID=UPI00191AE1CE|nr:hypothetical protein [Psychrobacter maritimus]